MQKGGMLKYITVVTLLMSAPTMDAAPQVSEEPNLYQVSLNRASQKLPDLWTSGPDIHETSATGSPAKLLRPAPVTSHSNEHGKTIGASTRLDKTTSIPSYLDKAFTPTYSSGRQLKIASMTIDSEELEKMVPAPSSFERHLKIDTVIDDPEKKEHTTRTGNGLYKELKLKPVTTVSNKQRKTLLGTSRMKMSLSTSSPDRQEKLMKMLTALEEIHRSMSSTLSSRITILTRGASNSRNSRKKSKMIIEGNLKSSTVSSLASSGTFSRASTDQGDPRLLNGKAFIKSMPSTPKKSNKRVCFWKYCSQN